MRQSTRLAAIAVVIGLGFAGCGESASNEAVTETVTESAPAPEAPASAPTPEPEPSEPVVKTVEVPDVVGENHQDAQDRMQAEGLYNLREKDATGQGRLLVLDSNWEVVSQSPTAGKRVSEDVVVALSSKKIGE